MNRYSISLLFLTLLLGLYIGGCQAESDKKPLPSNEENIRNGLTASERRVMAGRISNLAESVGGVQRAAVVVPQIDQKKDITILVGLTVSSELRSDEKKVSELKNTVTNKIIKNEKSVSEVLISVDPITVGRISDIAVGIVEGKPIEKDKKEIERLMRHLGKSEPQIIL
ncbi:MAG: hypothetical protein GX550_04535 [Syntrophomonadaceae bacterium]|nr:hypothetical protein [Syntrophomonadaceae bacterium]